MKFSLEKFSTHYREILANAVNLAKSYNYTEVVPEFLLISLLEQEDSIGQQLLKHANLDLQLIKKGLARNRAQSKTSPIFSASTVQVIDSSALLAMEQEKLYIGTEHLLLALLKSNDRDLNKLFADAHINYITLEQDLHDIFKKTEQLQLLFDESESDSRDSRDIEDDLDADIEEIEKRSFLELFARELTNPETTELEPIAGREAEIARVSEILLRKTKNNPLLIGEPGVGKTAVVEGLAWQIRQGNAPAELLDKKMYLLDLSALVAGTMYRGEFEARMKELLCEVRNNPDVIVFIDEIHNIVGAGSTQGSMDVANLIKPALARGEIRCIGATTQKEFKKYLEQDSALSRRFQKIQIHEPDMAQTTGILKTLKPQFEEHHTVTITKGAIEAAVTMSNTYIPDRYFPDKAIDILDEACSRKKMARKVSASRLKLNRLHNLIELYEGMKHEALMHERFDDAIAHKAKQEELDAERKKLAKRSGGTRRRPVEVTEKDIADIVASKTGLTAQELLRPFKKSLINLERNLKRSVVGQDRALRDICRLVRRAKLGLHDGSRPLASCIFAGPSGVGKTYTAKLLASEVFHHPEALIKIDMSEFSEAHSISKLLGSPAGYVGHREDSKLVASLKKRPASVVLFDEIEKAHPDIFNVLLQVLDDGYLTDSSGDRVDFTNTIVIMTSNLGTAKSDKALGFEQTAQSQKIFHEELKRFLRPELLNRIDQVISYAPLSDEVLENIIALELARMKKRFASKGISIRTYKSIMPMLAQKVDQSTGARSVKKIIQEEIEDAVIGLYLKSSQSNFSVKKNEDRIVVS